MIDYYETKSQPISRVMVWQAYKEVKSNAGSGGIDKMSWEYLQKNARTELYTLWNRLSSGSYFPKAVKQVAIPKKGGGERLLGIPTILDRIAQQVVRKHLERILEPKFHNSSFGYGPNRSCHQAVEQANANSFSHDLAIDIDIAIISPLLANLFLHVVFDKWMEKQHPEKPFERYADDIVVYCKTENQAKFMMRQINERMKSCKLQ